MDGEGTLRVCRLMDDSPKGCTATVLESIPDWGGHPYYLRMAVFKLTDKGQRRIQRLVINGAPVIIDSAETVLPTPEDLDPEYTYAEPTAVMPKDTVIWKEEYAFIDHNILVHCDQGSIVKATDTTFPILTTNSSPVSTNARHPASTTSTQIP